MPNEFDWCDCDYCFEGPFFTDDGTKVIHWCQWCQEEFVSATTCPGCEQFDRQIQASRFRDN